MATLLVTGGAGFIGGHIARQGVARGLDVVCLTRTRPKAGVMHDGVEWLAVDLADRDALVPMLRHRRIEYVVNAAGNINHASYHDGGRDVIGAHLDGVRNLVDCLDRESLRSFIALGSSDEYGDCAAPQDETMRERPISPYAYAKAAAGQFLQMLGRTEQFPAVVLRLFLVYGPGQKRDRFLPYLINGCLADASVPVSAGEQWRDFTYIDDVMSAVFAAMEADKVNGEIVNIGSARPLRLRDMMQRVRDKIGKGRVEFGAIPYRAGENMALYPDIAKANDLLGWHPAVGLSEGLDRTIEWHRQRA